MLSSVCAALGRPPFSVNASGASPLDTAMSDRYNGKGCAFPRHISRSIDDKLALSTISDSTWLETYQRARHICSECEGEREVADKILVQCHLASLRIIEHAFRVDRDRLTLCVWLSVVDVFTAGMVLMDSSLRRSSDPLLTVPEEWKQPLRRCLSLLTSFAECWSPGIVHRNVFEWLLENALP